MSERASPAPSSSDAARRDFSAHRRVLSGTVSNYVAQAVGLGLGFLLTPFILHQVGASVFGIWVLVGSIASYGTLFDFGISGAVIKYVAEYGASGDARRTTALIATALRLYMLLGACAALVIAALAPLVPVVFEVPPEAEAVAIWTTVLVGVSVGIGLPCATPVAVLRGLQRFDLSNALTVVGAVLSAAGTVAVLLAGGGLIGIVLVGIATTLLMQLPARRLVRRVAPELRIPLRGAERSLASTVVSFSVWVSLSQVADRLAQRTDAFVIGASLPLPAVTGYSLGQRLSQTAIQLTNQFVKVLFPLASEVNARGDRAGVRSLFLTTTRVTLVLSIPMAGILVALGPELLTAWVGGEYARYAHILTLLAIAGLVDTALWPAVSILMGMARHRTVGWISLGTGIANVALSVALIVPFGLTGVAIGTLAPAAVKSLGLLLPYAMRSIEVSGVEVLRRVMLPLLAPTAVLAVALAISKRVIDETAPIMLLPAVGVSLALFGLAYLAVGASAGERAFYASLLASVRRSAPNAGE